MLRESRVGLLTSLLSRSLENPSTPWDQAFTDCGAVSKSGARVDVNSALGYDAFWRCVSLISGDVSKLPLTVYRRDKDGGKNEDESQPAYWLLQYQVNDAITALQWKRVMTLHALMLGNGYSYIVRDGAGTPTELWPLNPQVTHPERVNGVIWYITQVGQETRKLPAEDVWHLMGLSGDGMAGYDVISCMKEVLGKGLAGDEFESRFFSNNARPNVVLKHPGKLKPEAKINIRESWERIHKGLANAHKTAVLEEGMDVTTLQHNLRDSQTQELKAFTRVQIANYFGVPPHKLGDNSRTSYNSLEQENEAYIEDGGGLGYWLPAFAAECWRKLLTEKQKASQKWTIAFKTRGLLRANLSTRTTYYIGMLQNGVLSANEVREEEGYNPREGGDEYLIPLNMTDANAEPGEPGGGDEGGNGTGGSQTPPAPAPTPPPPEQKALPSPVPPQDVFRAPGEMIEPLRDLVRDAYGRMVRRIGHAAQRAAREPGKFLAFVDSLEADHLDTVAEALGPVLRAARGLLGTTADGGEEAQDLLEGFRADFLQLAGDCTAASLASGVATYMATATDNLARERAAELFALGESSNGTTHA